MSILLIKKIFFFIDLFFGKVCHFLVFVEFPYFILQNSLLLISLVIIFC